MSLTALRTVAVAVGAIVAEVVGLLPVLVVQDWMARSDSLHHASYGVRAFGAVVTLGLSSLAPGAAAFIALRVGRRWLRVNLLGAVFIVAVFNGLALYYFLSYTTWVNDSVWNVPFPLGGRNEFR